MICLDAIIVIVLVVVTAVCWQFAAKPIVAFTALVVITIPIDILCDASRLIWEIRRNPISIIDVIVVAINIRVVVAIAICIDIFFNRICDDFMYTSLGISIAAK